MTLWEGMLVTIEKEFSQLNRENFLRHRMISRALSPNNKSVTSRYLDHVRNNFYCSINILPKVLDSEVGNPIMTEGYSQGTVQHCHYLNMMLEHLGLRITDFNHITDVGGGYGNFYRIVKNLGYQGIFDIPDFPIMHDIQRYYIEELKLDLPNFISIKDLNPKSRSILFGFHSINEMPMSDRKILEEQYSMYDNIMILYNDIFDRINNLEYFDKLKNKLSNIFDVKIIKDDLKPNGRFLIGSKRK